MHIILKLAGAAGLLALAGCGGGADDRAAENIESAAENRADALDDLAANTTNEQVEDALATQADNVREAGDDAADRADDTDDARVEGQNGM